MMIKKVYSLQCLAVYSTLFFLALFTVHCSLYTACFAQPISSTELINNAKQYDGKAVVYAGEVIGDIMERGNFAWVNINDGYKAIGIWINQSLLQDIFYTGSYKSKGDWVEVSGIFQRACLEHGGDLDIHAQSIKKISPGRQLNRRLNTPKRNLAFILFGVLSIIWILRLYKRK